MEYTIKFDEKDFPVLSAALAELPFKIAAPLIDKINRQIVEQHKKEKPAPSGASSDNL